MQFIRENAHRPIDINDVARAINTSRSALKRLFAKYRPGSVRAEIQAAHLHRAKELLSRSDMPMKRVAVESGFASTDYFAYVFRKTEGVSPADFRRLGQR